MLVAGDVTSRAIARWRRGLWAGLLVAALAALSLTPYMRASTELVRMRNALLLTDQRDVEFNWTPANVPASFQWEKGPIDPYFAEIAQRLQLAALPDDWQRALVISRHLLGSSPVLNGGPIMSDLRQTHRRIVESGDGYCGDFVDVFIAIAVAAGMPVRAWAFSFDGFGGHGHIWSEIWNRELGRWQLVDIFNNTYFTGASGTPLSALDFRQALLGGAEQIERSRLYPAGEFGMRIDSTAWNYYRRGLPEWYMWWGNNVFAYDRAPLVRLFSGVSRSLEQLGGIAQGVSPRLQMLVTRENQRQVDAIERLRLHLQIVSVVIAVSLLVMVVSLLRWFWLKHKRWESG